MAKYHQCEVTGFVEQVTVEINLEAETIKSLVAGNTHQTLHGQIGKKASGRIVTESDPTAKAFTTATAVAFVFADVAGSSDLTITFPTVEYNSVKSSAGAGDTNPVQFEIGFEAVVPATMQ
jgi:hypothetical protein